MKTCFHSHLYAIFHVFYGVQLKQLYTFDFLYVFNPFKMTVQFRFSQFDGGKCFFPQIQQTPGPDFRKVGKSLQSLKIPLVILMEVPVYIGILDL